VQKKKKKEKINLNIDKISSLINVNKTTKDKKTDAPEGKTMH